MKKLMVVAVMLVMAGISTIAQAGVCEDLSASIDRSLGLIQINEKSLSDFYFTRETPKIEQLMDKVAIGNEWQQININIQLMAQNKCPPRAEATNYNRFK